MVARGTFVRVVCEANRYPLGVPVEDVRLGAHAYCYYSSEDDVRRLTIRRVIRVGPEGFRQIIKLFWQVDGRARPRARVGAHESLSHPQQGCLALTPDHLVRLLSDEYMRAEHISVGEYILSCPYTPWCAPQPAKAAGSLDATSCRRIIAVDKSHNAADVYRIVVEGAHNVIAGGLCVYA